MAEAQGCKAEKVKANIPNVLTERLVGEAFWDRRSRQRSR
jgi:hypothetical protein